MHIFQTVQVNGSASFDPSGFIPLTYHWTQTGDPNVTLSDNISLNPTFLVHLTTSNTDITFQLVVTNTKGTHSNPSYVTVTVHLVPQIKGTVHDIFDIIKEIVNNPSSINSNALTSLRDASQSLTNYGNHNLSNSPINLSCSIAQQSLNNLYNMHGFNSGGQQSTILSNEQLNAIHNALGCR